MWLHAFVSISMCFHMFSNICSLSLCWMYFPLFIRNSMSFHIIHRPLVDFKDKQATAFSGCMTFGCNIHEPTEGSLSSLHKPSNMVPGNAWRMRIQYISATWKNVNKVKNKHIGIAINTTFFWGGGGSPKQSYLGSLYLDQFGWLDNRHRPVTSWYSRLWSGWWHRDLCAANFSGGNSSRGLQAPYRG